MRFAETGFNLEVDLTRGNIEREATDPKLTALYLGGLGTNAKILWDRVPPEVEPFSPDNLLIFSTGLLVGTPAVGCNRTIVSTFSPQTLLMAYSMMGGFWAPELKYAGYDKLIIHGKSPDLVYLWINNDKVEIRDASHLQGKGATETAELIRQELKEPKAQVASIGLAGENRVYFASIEQGRSSASRGGIGAVMGDKGLKAIAVRGTNDVNIARPDEFIELCNEALEYIKVRRENPIPGVMPILAGLGSPQEMAIHDEKWHTENFAWGNSRHRRKGFWNEEIEKQWTDTMENYRTRLISCHNCPMKCGATISIPGFPTYMMKCFSKLTYAMAAMSDLEFGLRIAQSATEYGMDGFTAPQVMAFALELYEAGILTDKDMPGMPSDNEGRFYWLLDKIVRREGIGDVLANGTYWAAKEIGNGAEEYAHNNIKKHEQLPLKLGMLNPIYFLMYSTGEKINITQIEGNFPQAPFATREEREEFVKDWIQVPDEKFKKWFLDWELRGENSIPYYPTVEATCEIVDWQEKMHYIDDATGMCAGLSSFPLKPPYHIHNLPTLISAATGMDLDESGLTQIAKRIRNLVRAVNIRRGMRRKDEKPPEDHWKKRFPELETKLLDEYYKFKGWNEQGIPTRESLHELGLDYVSEDFLQRGILTDVEGSPSEKASTEK
ncbi:MAG: aldehyde dehydrogenase [Candidatus Latescibacteria bacterium]|nr:aldehyde dehydrogenase [Candidatus Latescibacterota bacterium]NIO28399.1 aldehyde dehydrogenase [Candidatus Latescibacterota bacterium]NIO55948.1 aldehyde dehydrogenase [Candidatus Latescibacterota bacterium]NIT01912.1 aldehyde dehydrogenase [Candidatus Latescibacterota bacterium]